MTDKIKKVNSLEELDKLTPGDFVKMLNCDWDVMFEQKVGEEYQFIEINCPVVWSYRINKGDIEFKYGMIKAEERKIQIEIYNKGDKLYKEKLNLIKRPN